jgi:hypothetical protein
VLRRLGMLVIATCLTLGGGIALAGSAAAGRPQDAEDHDCRIGLMCNRSLHWGWQGPLPPRNVGG